MILWNDMKYDHIGLSFSQYVYVSRSTLYFCRYEAPSRVTMMFFLPIWSDWRSSSFPSVKKPSPGIMLS